MKMLPFHANPLPLDEEPIETNEEIPKELNIFFRSENAFLPEGKTLADLTSDELKQLRAKYRFDPYKPGLYQTITGFGKMV